MDSFQPPAARVGHCFAVRISVGAKDLEQVFSDLSTMCDGLMVVEHTDEDASRNHVHMAIYNTKLTHDPYRRAVLKVIKERVITDMTGNALMSVKKWDGNIQYLVYMLKGDRSKVVFNNVLNDDYIKWLRGQWVSKSQQENLYQAYIKSTHYYKKPVSTFDDYGNVQERAPKEQEMFDQLKDSIIAFVLKRHGGYINAKVRYEVKDLLSNYCLFNRLKMFPVYI